MMGIRAAAMGGSMMILAVALLRLTMAKRLPRRGFPILWCVAALRLLLPVELPSVFSVWNLFGSAPLEKQAVAISEAVSPFPSLSATTQTGTATLGNASAPQYALFWVWLGAALLLAAYFIIGYVLTVRCSSGHRLAAQPEIDRLLDRFSVSRDPIVRATQSRRAPLTYGVFHPTVLMPDDLPVGGVQFSFVLAHELAHIRRKDCLRKILFTACLCLYWWNPLVWGMVWLANRDMELACDEAVLRVLGVQNRKAYALTLLDLAQRQAQIHPMCSGFAKSAAEERIRAIMKPRRISVFTSFLAVLLSLMVVTVFATQAAPKQSAPADKQQAAVSEVPPKLQPQDETVHAFAPETRVISETPEVADSERPDTGTAPDEKPAAYIWPLEDTQAEITNGYGYRMHPQLQKEVFHSGIDLAACLGSNVLAVADGTVTDCRYDEANGYIVTLDHGNGLQTQYAHLSEFLVQPGDTVQQGQVIAASGASGWATGPHLHFGVLQDGEAADPVKALQSQSEW